MSDCYCGRTVSFSECCEPLILGQAKAFSAEQLMRSRYSAFATGAVDYIFATTHPEQRKDLDRNLLEQWSKNSKWLGLEIKKTERGGAGDTDGVVEFHARYGEGENVVDHREVSRFQKVGDTWYFDMRRSHGPPLEKAKADVGRNDPCPCGSGKKFKKCCGAAA